MKSRNVIGRNMYLLRTASQRTIEQMAAVVHVSKSVYHRYEIGKVIPRDDVICTFASHFNIPPDLLTQDYAGIIRTKCRLKVMTEDEHFILQTYDMLSPQDKAKLIEQLRKHEEPH